jgi:hypothetical protein
MVNEYLTFVDAHDVRAGAQGTYGTTVCGQSNAQGDVMVH